MLKTHNRRGRGGFTLLELSIVLTIIGVVTGGGIAIFAAWIQSSQVNVTIARMDAIEKALLNYGVAFGRIPCPSDLTIAAGATNYGAEAASNSGTCYGGTPSATSQWTGTSTQAVEGGVPTRALRLPDAYMYDAYGHRFRYAVDPSYTTTGTLPVSSGLCSSSAPAGLTVYDASGAARTTGALYVLLSHGQNGHGAYGYKGGTTMLNAGSNNTHEQANCHCSQTASASGTAPAYWQQLPATTTTGNVTYNFDDIVTFKEPWQIQSQSVTLASAAPCIFVSDQNGNRIEELTTTGGFVMGIGSGYQNAGGSVGAAGTGNGQFNGPSLGRVDSSGNIYVADGNCRYQKFNSAGTWLLNVGTGYNGVPGSPNTCANGGGGQVYSAADVAVDKSGNIWAADSGACRIQEYNSAGSYLNVTWGSCGAGSGKFYGSMAIAFDSYSNLWVSDQGNNRIQELNASGSVLLTIPASGCQTASVPSCTASAAYGQFSGQGNINFDLSGNLWVPDTGNNRIQEFSSGGSYITTLPTSGCTTSSIPACGYSSASGQFSGPGGLAFDSSGYMWVADAYNNRVQKLDSSGNFYLQFPCSSGTCAASTANGSFNLDYTIAIIGR